MTLGYLSIEPERRYLILDDCVVRENSKVGGPLVELHLYNPKLDLQFAQYPND